MSNFGKNVTVEEQDGSPSVVSVRKIKVTNGQLTDNGNGVVSLSTGGSASDPLSLHLNGDNANGRLYLSLNTYLDFSSGSTVGLYINDTLVQDWTVASTGPVSGSPIGLLLAITQA